MSRLLVLVTLLSLTSCTPWVLGGESPVPPATPQGPVLPASTEAASDPAPLPPPASPTPPPVTYQEPPPEKPPPVRKGRAVQEPLTPEKLIQQAEKAAVVRPTARGYHGGSALHRYPWGPNKLYAVYVSHEAGTKVVLPPGQILVAQPFLPETHWDISTARVGNDLVQTDIIFFRAQAETTGEANVSLLTQSGYSFDLRLIVSKTPMFGVTFELAPIARIELDDRPALARPHP